MAEQLLAGPRGKPLRQRLGDLASDTENGADLFGRQEGGLRQLRSAGEPLD